MTGPSGRNEGNGGTGNSWEQRAAGLASEVQRWLIRTSAKNVRDELGGQVRKAFRGQDADPGDVWGTATTEPPRPADEAPECAWCPVCRAARRISEARAGTSGGGGPKLADAADVMASAVSQVLAGLDSVLSYRPGDLSGTSQRRAEAADGPEPKPGPEARRSTGSGGPADEPGARPET